MAFLLRFIHAFDSINSIQFIPSMPMSSQSLTFAVITATVGRPELERAILSVQAQHYPCRHYVFVDGEQYADAVRPLQTKYPDVVFTYLPFNTGANGWYNSRIIASASCLLQEDIICILDDDNWYEPEHTLTLARLFQAEPKLDFAYTLRNFYDAQNRFIAQDMHESLGYFSFLPPHAIESNIEINQKSLQLFSKPNNVAMIDANCYAFKQAVAIQLAPYWLEKGWGNDVHVFNQITRLKLLGACTGCFSVNYISDYNKAWNQASDLIQKLHQLGFSEEEISISFHSVINSLNQHNIQAYLNAYQRLPWLDNRSICMPDSNQSSI